jgi:hypothetical protein
MARTGETGKHTRGDATTATTKFFRPVADRGPVSTAAFCGSTLAYAAGGPLLDLTSARAVFLIAGVGILVVTAFLWTALRREVRPVSRG